MVSVKIFTADDTSGAAGAAEGYDYLIALKKRGVNIRVVNNSWGGPVPSQALYEAVCAAEAAGILSVCSAGNSHHDADAEPGFPAGLDCESLISVAASTRDDEMVSFSNYGALTVDLAAPGESVLSTWLFISTCATASAPSCHGSPTTTLGAPDSITVCSPSPAPTASSSRLIHGPGISRPVTAMERGTCS
ncbi:MAG: hypothetical protein E6L09_05700 [Verrucomicrobia bacterium]|nr:MAG: hypothetical protein E6L09_05700 [Verrucomicrobiota bacterium]